MKTNLLRHQIGTLHGIMRNKAMLGNQSPMALLPDQQSPWNQPHFGGPGFHGGPGMHGPNWHNPQPMPQYIPHPGHPKPSLEELCEVREDKLISSMLADLSKYRGYEYFLLERGILVDYGDDKDMVAFIQIGDTDSYGRPINKMVGWTFKAKRKDIFQTEDVEAVHPQYEEDLEEN